MAKACEQFERELNISGAVASEASIAQYGLELATRREPKRHNGPPRAPTTAEIHEIMREMGLPVAADDLEDAA